MEKIGVLDPVNRLAKQVTGGGTHFEIDLSNRPDYEHYNQQPDLASYSEYRKNQKQRYKGHYKFPKTLPNLTGVRNGRLTVLGIATGKLKLRWVVRCDCGDYEYRSTKSITNLINDKDMCEVCRRTFFITKRKTFNDDKSDDERKRGVRKGE